MSVTVGLRTRTRTQENAKAEGCWGDSLCLGDRLVAEHASRLAWWLVGGLVILALVLDALIMRHAHNTANFGSWSMLSPSSWIHPTPHALASLVGLAIVLDAYTSYMMALRKGHVDKYVGQFLLSMVIRISLWLFFLYGVAYGGTIGSMLSLVVLGVILVWGMMTSHQTSPLHAWISVLELAFVVFLIIWLSTSNVKLWPSP